MKTHTKGEWSSKSSTGNGVLFIISTRKDKKQKIIAQIYETGSGEMVANAKVIKAAPKMLRALKECVEDLGERKVLAYAYYQAKEAIKDAE